MRPSSAGLPTVIVLSLRLYRWLLRLGPAEYREAFAGPTLQVLRQCCLDAYHAYGTLGVLRRWPTLFGELVIGMLAEWLVVERRRQMLPTMRRSMIITLVAFLCFAVSYVFLAHIVDPAPPFARVASQHADIAFASKLINWGVDLACLTVVVGGLPLLFSAIRRAFVERRGLALFTLRPRHWLLLLGTSCALVLGFVASLLLLSWLAGAPVHPANPSQSLPPLALVGQVGALVLVTFLMLTGLMLLARTILRSEFSLFMLRYALTLMAVTVVAMLVSFVGTLLWLLRLWADIPQFADSQGLGPAGLHGALGGSEGVVVVLVMMACAVVATAFAFQRGYIRRSVAAV